MGILLYNKLEYLTYNVVVMGYVLVVLALLLLLICSSSLIIGKLQSGSIGLELLCSLVSVVIVWLVISPSLIFVMDIEGVVVVSSIIHSLGVQ